MKRLFLLLLLLPFLAYNETTKSTTPSMDGVNYEGIGIPADIDVNYLRDGQSFLRSVMNDLDNNGDVTIEKVLELIRE